MAGKKMSKTELVNAVATQSGLEKKQVNAVLDALAPYGLRHVDMPLTPSRLWHAMTGVEHPSS